jgi:hypothetical protein
MATLTKQDWTKIHDKAWHDDKFRYLLETDPTTAVKSWYLDTYKTDVDKIVDLSDWINEKDELDWNHGPPSCC